MEEHVIDDAEDDCGSTDAEGQGKDGYQGKPVIFREVAEGIAEVTEEIVEVRFPASVADLLFNAFAAAGFLLGSTAGFPGPHACGNVVGDLSLEMEAKLRVEIAFIAGFAKEAAKPTHG